MLGMRPNCECCDCDLAATDPQAMICSYECTFCGRCVADVLKNVCPNCGGGFVQRPLQPSNARQEGVSLQLHPASTERRLTSFSVEEVSAFSALHAHCPPEER
ncbi:MAG: DUF1272 domain-containing protein [Pseudomonadota bacterium]